MGTVEWVVRVGLYKQWDVQERKRMLKLESDREFIWLNNTYLQIERGSLKLDIHSANQLRIAVQHLFGGFAGQAGRDLEEHWLNELTKLPRWLEV